MKKIQITDFSGGMVQRTSPDDYKPGEVGYMYGFVPEDDQSIRSQWPIQSIGDGNVEDASSSWISTAIGYDPAAHLVSIYPLRGTDGVFLVATRDDGSIWWTKAPGSDATHVGATASVWLELTGDQGDEFTVKATNQGYDVLANYDAQPSIWVERNPDYRFICDIPLEVYKYIRKGSNSTLVGGVTIPGSHTGRTAHPPYADFSRDEVPNEGAVDDFGFPVTQDTANPRSVVSGVLLHSRRFYNGSDLTRTKDLNSTEVVSRASSTGAGPYTVRVYVADNAEFVVGSTVVSKVYVSGVYNTNLSSESYVTAVGSDVNGEYIEYSKTTGAVVAATTATGTVYRKYRTQTAVICYIDPYANDGDGGVRAITFPNLRRFPTFTTDAVPTFESIQKPMPAWAVSSNRSQMEYPFMSKYPFNGGAINSDISATSTPNLKSAYPKPDHVFHPYTYLNTSKVGLPGTGIIPRGNVGVMWNGQLIVGDIEWREDASAAYLNEKRLTPTANHFAASTRYAGFGLRDGNTEPHRGFMYFAEDEIDKFDPRSVLRASGTDTRIAGMHFINNRLITITTSGSDSDGVITFSGNLSQLHPYNPATLANPLAIRREVIKGGIGTADTTDLYNHGNPQTCLWPEFGQVAFIDKSGYVFVTDGQNVSLLDERFPIKGRPNGSTVNDHVAAVGKNLFVYKNGYLYTYTSINNKGAWSVLHRPLPLWGVDVDYKYTAYNVIRSMRGIGTELYFIVHTYVQEIDNDDNPIGNITLEKSRVMRYALNGPSSERGSQDGNLLPGLIFETPSVGTSTDSININWHRVGINFYSEGECALNGYQVLSTYPSGRNYPTDRSGVVLYSKGNIGDDVLTDTTPPLPDYSTPLVTYTEGFHDFELRAGVGPQKVISTKFSFRGDVKVEGVTFWFTGNYPVQGGE